jgi:hypothetical protein
MTEAHDDSPLSRSSLSPLSDPTFTSHDSLGRRQWARGGRVNHFSIEKKSSSIISRGKKKKTG